MHSAKLTINKLLPVLIVACGLQHTVFAQENSPYSRYGLGDMVPKTNIVSRAMGGISAGFSDYQSINFTNPASYSNLKSTIFDIGIEADSRTLKSLDPLGKFNSTNLVPSYMQLGFPIKMKKANKKDIFWGMNMGLRPVSKINYKILQQERLPGVDSTGSVYEGTGGLSQACLGTAISIKHFSLGVNGGYQFGNKNNSTLIVLINDTVQYSQALAASKTNFGGLFINAGIQYDVKFRNKKTGKRSLLRYGAYGNLKQTMTATNNFDAETVFFDADGNKTRIDSVYESNTSGKIIYPSTLGVGITYQTLSWLFGADFETTKWQDYRYFGKVEEAQNSWKIRVGTEYYPLKDNTSYKKYFNFVKYRFGFYYGPDYVKVTKSLPEYGFSFGAGFPLKLKKSYYETQTSMLNTSFEFGKRGSKDANLRESTFRVCLGFSLSDLWFGRAKYQ